MGGVGLVVWACMQRFRRYLLTGKMPPWLEAAAHTFETFGNATREWLSQASESPYSSPLWSITPKTPRASMANCSTLASHPYGVVALAIVAAGFFAFGLTSAFEANYRDVKANVKTRREPAPRPLVDNLLVTRTRWHPGWGTQFLLARLPRDAPFRRIGDALRPGGTTCRTREVECFGAPRKGSWWKSEKGIASRAPRRAPSLGEALELPLVHARQPILAVRGR